MDYFTTKSGDTILAMARLSGNRAAVLLIPSYIGWATALMDAENYCNHTEYFDTLAEARASFQKRAYREA